MAFAKHERDQIAYHKKDCLFPDWEWYTKNAWKTKSWWLKVPFSFALDGWHFMESLIMASVSTLIVINVSMLYNVYIVWLILLGVALYGIIGGVHSLLDGSLFRKDK